jgi:hypothetical protein
MIWRVLKMDRWRKMPLLTELGNYLCPGSIKMPRLRRDKQQWLKNVIFILCMIFDKKLIRI